MLGIQGVGLGFAIAKWVVEAHGGSIRADSVGEIDAKFSVVLPAATAPDA